MIDNLLLVGFALTWMVLMVVTMMGVSCFLVRKRETQVGTEGVAATLTAATPLVHGVGIAAPPIATITLTALAPDATATALNDVWAEVLLRERMGEK